jgi:hypothetical protein
MLSTYTHHARARMQQRGIRAEALEALFEYGRSAPAGRGCEVLFIDKAARKAARLPNAYVVVGRDGTVVTVGHRYRRVPRGLS